MRKIIPSVLMWWKERSAGPHEDLNTLAPRNDFERRWPLGPVAHPQILNIVRIYFLETYKLNLENEARARPLDRPQLESDWGEDDQERDVKFMLPIDLLVYDLEMIAPDVFNVVSNLVFVPVGQSPDEEFC